jgi:hypothetical protein
MDSLKLAFYVIMAVSAFLCLAVLLSEFWKYTKLIPFLLIRAALKIRSLFLKPVPIQSKQTDARFTALLILSDLASESETAPHIYKKQSFNRSEFARSRKRKNGRFA